MNKCWNLEADYSNFKRTWNLYLTFKQNNLAFHYSEINQLLDEFQSLNSKKIKNSFLSKYFLVQDHPTAILQKLEKNRISNAAAKRQSAFSQMNPILLPIFLKLFLFRAFYFFQLYGNFLILNHITESLKEGEGTRSLAKLILLLILLLVFFGLGGVFYTRYTLNRSRLEMQGSSVLRLLIFEKILRNRGTLAAESSNKKNKSSKKKIIDSYKIILV